MFRNIVVCEMLLWNIRLASATFEGTYCHNDKQQMLTCVFRRAYLKLFLRIKCERIENIKMNSNMVFSIIFYVFILSTSTFS